MIDVTFKLEAVKHHSASGITWIKLQGDDDFDWVLANHPDTPEGFISISGANNSSFRIIEKAAFEQMLNAAPNRSQADNSAFRTSEQNSKVKGSTKSMHRAVRNSTPGR